MLPTRMIRHYARPLLMLPMPFCASVAHRCQLFSLLAAAAIMPACRRPGFAARPPLFAIISPPFSVPIILSDAIPLLRRFASPCARFFCADMPTILFVTLFQVLMASIFDIDALLMPRITRAHAPRPPLPSFLIRCAFTPLF